MGALCCFLLYGWWWGPCILGRVQSRAAGVEWAHEKRPKKRKGHFLSMGHFLAEAGRQEGRSACAAWTAKAKQCVPATHTHCCCRLLCVRCFENTQSVALPSHTPCSVTVFCGRARPLFGGRGLFILARVLPRKHRTHTYSPPPLPGPLARPRLHTPITSLTPPTFFLPSPHLLPQSKQASSSTNKRTMAMSQEQMRAASEGLLGRAEAAGLTVPGT